MGLCGWWGSGQRNVSVQWIVDAMRFQKIYGLNTAECHKVEKWSGRLGSGWVWWVWWVCVGDGWVVSGSVNSGCHKLSENIWFVWSKTSYSGDKWRCYRCGTGQTTSEDRATQLLIWETLSLAISESVLRKTSPPLSTTVSESASQNRKWYIDKVCKTARTSLKLWATDSYTAEN